MNELFAGIPIKDFESSVRWYENFLDKKPSFFPHKTEAVWELAESRYVFIVLDKAKAGNALTTFFVEDLDSFLDKASKQMITPSKDEMYPNNVQKLTYHDPDGNEFGICGINTNK